MAALTAEVDSIASNLPASCVHLSQVCLVSHAEGCSLTYDAAPVSCSLAWSPSQTDPILAHQAADVHIAIQTALTLINRPALPDYRSPKAALVSAISFDVAVSAAHKASMIYLDYAKRSNSWPRFWPFFFAASDAATTLSTAIFGWQLAGLVVDEPALIKSLQDCWLGMIAGQGHAAALKPAVGWIRSILERKKAAPDDPVRTAPMAQASTADQAAPVDPQPWTTFGQYGHPAETFDYAALLQNTFSLDAFGFGLGFDDSPLAGSPIPPQLPHGQPSRTFP
jgi:hypothetical protein